MKPMIYTKERRLVILDKGKKGEYLWCIVSLGTHPRAYVGIPPMHPVYGLDEDKLTIDIHGGVTYTHTELDFNPISGLDLWWIGWDYGHSGDYMGYYEEDKELSQDKKWTTEEIKVDVMNVIEQLKRMK